VESTGVENRMEWTRSIGFEEQVRVQVIYVMGDKYGVKNEPRIEKEIPAGNRGNNVSGGGIYPVSPRDVSYRKLPKC